jgi:hypothetical protein
MNVFVFDLLPYDENLDHLKEGKELPWPLPRRHFKPEVAVCTYAGILVHGFARGPLSTLRVRASGALLGPARRPCRRHLTSPD